MCTAHSKKQSTFYEVARERHIPSWLISLRHTLTHAQNIPDLKLLKEAIDTCLKWLKTAYWQPQDEIIKDQTIDENESNTINVEDIADCYCDLVQSSVSNTLLTKNIRCKLQTLKIQIKTSIDEMKVYLLDVLEKRKLNRNLFITEVASRMIRNTPQVSQGNLPQKYLNSWEHYFTYLREYGTLIVIIEKLVDVVLQETMEDNIRSGSSIWLNHIFSQLLRSKQCEGVRKLCSVTFKLIK